MNKFTVLLLGGLLFITGCSSPDETPEVETAVTPVAPSAIPTENPTPSPTPANVEEVVEYEMARSFDYFWEQVNTDVNSPGYGLVRDRYPGSEGIASTAAVGFGLTAYPIGVEKGYISYEEGHDRADGTLDTLLAMERVEGFYYHFVDMETGKRAWQSEVSSIDTAILLMGVLTAGEYFGGEIQNKAEQIYDGVNWPWFVDESRAMFYMAYRPEEGFAGHWDFYAEQLMLYLLAAGSDTHPTDEAPYYSFTRHYASYGEGKPFIHSWFGSLFTYQYSHAWIDFREYTDKEGVNWFDNSVEASLSHFNFAATMDSQYVTLGPDAWGLTACDGPNGYNGLYGAPPSGFDNHSHLVDDTIPPSGAIGSMIFLPQEAEQAMLNYYSLEPLKGEYGFLDAYNLSEDWYATDVIGIDKGITLLMLANYQSDLVHRIVMQNEQILNGLGRLQITKSR
ncbi:MAG: glucoamylase family protein [Chloroflexota bacterium]